MVRLLKDRYALTVGLQPLWYDYDTSNVLDKFGWSGNLCLLGWRRPDCVKEDELFRRFGTDLD